MWEILPLLQMGVEKLMSTVTQLILYPGVETGVEEMGKGMGFLTNLKLNSGS